MRKCFFAQRKELMQGKNGYKFNIPSYVQDLILRLRSFEESAYIVGGSLRDMLMGREPHDFDLATSAEPMRVCEIFSDMRVIKTGIAHGTVTVISEGRPVEITTFRVDGDYLDMRRPESVSFTRRLEDDLSRRDFTVNAMAYNECDGLIDLFSGLSDLNSKTIRTVGNAYERFSEDALRIMRALRFSAQLGFEIESDTLEAIVALSEGLEKIARERIFSELLLLICSSEPTRALELFADSGVAGRVLPFIPDRSAIALVSLVDNDDISRLSALLCELDGERAREVLIALKASGRQRAVVSAVIDASKRRYATREEIARLRGALGEDAKIALRLSVLLGNSEESIFSLINDQTPCSIRELAIGGEELLALGYGGREIGRALAFLLDEVIREPSANTREELLRRASERLSRES